MSRSKTVSGRLLHLGAWCLAHKLKDTEIDYAFVMSFGTSSRYSLPYLRVNADGFLRLAKSLKPTVQVKLENQTLEISFQHDGVKIIFQIEKKRLDELPDSIRNSLAAIAAANQTKRIAGVPLRLTGPGVGS